MFYRRFAIILLASVLGMANFPLLGASSSREAGFVNTNPPKAVPAFSFEDEKGRSIDFRDFHGRYVLLNLWDTTCAPCVTEMPKLDQLSDALGDKRFAVIALNEDHAGADIVRLFYKRHAIKNLPVYIDGSGRAPFVLHARGLPTTILLDPQGMEIARLEGAADWTSPSMIEFLQSKARP
ncbi:MAG: TlpA family protein disulfide reductase [Bdellovibrionales bacterium]